LDGHSCEATFFNIDEDLFDPTTLHVFGSPCLVLDSRLQSGIAGPPKWEPRSRLGIYVGHSPSHASSVALVLNPRTGHVSPQFHVVFDDLFTMVLYMKKNEVPPNWAKLIEKSSERITDEVYNLAKTWLFPDADLGDIAMQTNSRTHAGPFGNNICTAHPSGHHISLQEVDFYRSNDVLGISQEDSIPCLYSDSVIDSLPSVQDDHSVPPLINLETSDLRQSPRLTALQHNNNALAIAAYTTSTIPISSRLFTKPRPRLLFLSVFNLVVLCGHLPPQALIWIMRPFLLWHPSRTTMIV
jgi:hypothetical protein